VFKNKNENVFVYSCAHAWCPLIALGQLSRMLVGRITEIFFANEFLAFLHRHQGLLRSFGGNFCRFSTLVVKFPVKMMQKNNKRNTEVIIFFAVVCSY